MMVPEVLERIAARRAELDGLEEQLVKQLSVVRAERDELAVAERVWQRMSEQLADERTGPGRRWSRWQVGRCGWSRTVGRGWLSALPAEYQCILTAVRQAAGPVSARQIGEVLGLDTVVRASWSRCAGSSRSWPTAAGCTNDPTGS